MSYPPQGGYGGGPPQAAPDSNMTIAVVSLVVGALCSCLGAIPGIVAVVNAGKVGGLAASGNYGAAQEASANARKWAIIGFVVTGVLFVLWLLLNFVVLAGDNNN